VRPVKPELDDAGRIGRGLKRAPRREVFSRSTTALFVETASLDSLTASLMTPPRWFPNRD
jgi:hypothetical protein